MLKTMITKLMNSGKEEIVDLKEVKTTYYGKEFDKNLEITLAKALEWIEEKNYMLTYGSNEITKFVDCKLNPDNLTQNRRKKIAKYMYFFLSRPSRKKLNTLLHYIHKTNETKMRYRVEKSLKEQAIDSKRKAYKELKAETEKARLAFIEEKGDFYKKQLSND